MILRMLTISEQIINCLIVIFLIVTRQIRPPLEFIDDLDYFHQFDLHRLFDKYDVCIHSCTNFELLLDVEYVFYPQEFILKNMIDYRSIYLNRYYNPLRLR